MNLNSIFRFPRAHAGSKRPRPAGRQGGRQARRQAQFRWKARRKTGDELGQKPQRQTNHFRPAILETSLVRQPTTR